MKMAGMKIKFENSETNPIPAHLYRRFCTAELSIYRLKACLNRINIIKETIPNIVTDKRIGLFFPSQSTGTPELRLYLDSTSGQNRRYFILDIPKADYQPNAWAQFLGVNGNTSNRPLILQNLAVLVAHSSELNDPFLQFLPPAQTHKLIYICEMPYKIY